MGVALVITNMAGAAGRPIARAAGKESHDGVRADDGRNALKGVPVALTPA